MVEMLAYQSFGFFFFLYLAFIQASRCNARYQHVASSVPQFYRIQFEQLK
jgi:hypothetical protein